MKFVEDYVVPFVSTAFIMLFGMVVGGVKVMTYCQEEAVKSGHAVWAESEDGTCKFEWKEIENAN